jgi:cytochrome c oxidase accessory protein FixG
MTIQPAAEETFRDTLGIVSTEGKRKWIYPKKPSGSYYRLRTVLSTCLLAFLFGMPLVTVHGHPFMLFNIIERKFILFGSVFGPHDFYLLVLAMITLIVFVILFTVVFGRLFCGWVCPQTVFLEMVFRRIDYWIEGNHRQQQRLSESPWTAEKILRKGLRFAIYFALAFLIGNTLLAWIIGVRDLHQIITDPPSRHLAGLTAMVAFSVLFYWIFIWFREQACILVCPYGRLQGVLLDRNSIVIAYDYVRGEPRGKIRKEEERTAGDCIDCHLCVDVCPTGIDIRNGTQLECVNCTACIDACDAVMDKVSKPRGLIRYDSADNIATRTGFRWTGRIIAYAGLLTVLTGALVFLLLNRKDLDVTVLRTPGMFFQEQPDGRVSNVYDVKILNKTFAPATISLRLQDTRGEVRFIGDSLRAAPQEIAEAKLLIILNRSALHGMTTPVVVGVYDGDRLLENLTTSFLGPGR